MTKRNKLIVLLIVFIFSFGIVSAQDAPTGWSFGGVPAVAYNSDTGFLYGVILDVYNYGDGSQYPDYLYTTRLTWTRTTKGSGENIIFFDSKYLLPGDVRITAEAAYLTEQALPFYGFNGENDPALEYEDDDDYVSRVFYRHERNITKLTADFQKSFLLPNLRGIVGLAYYNTEVAPVDTAKLNDGKDAEDRLPVVETLYDEYIQSGDIGELEALGGQTNYLKLGLVYDTRDNEPNPMKGIWSEALITLVPDALGNDFSYTLLTATHRQYFTLIPEDLSLAVRLAYQTVISGDIPFFMLPHFQSSFRATEGMGGSKSLRGILKNRLVGQSIAFSNLELRWKVLRTQLLGQNLYLALNGFVDAGMILDEYGWHDPEIDQGLHMSYGGGLRIALNENFIVAVDYGLAADELDGTSGLYIGLGYLF